MSEYFKRINGASFKLENPVPRQDRACAELKNPTPHQRAERQQDDMRAMKELFYNTAETLQVCYKLATTEIERFGIRAQLEAVERLHLNAEHNMRTYSAIKLNHRPGNNGFCTNKRGRDGDKQ